MGLINILDCTLRDGGYCNNWVFGYENIKKIVTKLLEAGIDIIECGYFSKSAKTDRDRTVFQSFDEIDSLIPKVKKDRVLVGMINYGEYEIEDIPDCSDTLIDGIRVAFHKNQWKEAVEYSKRIKDKGYKVFIQGMVSLSYADDEFIELIKAVNQIKPYAFYIVDSFGMMKSKEVIRLFYMVEHILCDDIAIGFHSHNNMQLAYANCLSIIQANSNRSIILDSSVYGMGRGAGNLNTELLIQYLNENEGTTYELSPLLTIIDEILDEFYQENRWGYSLPNYISARYCAHPNYALFLSNRKTLTIDDIDKIFQMMDEEKKVIYDKDYIAELYWNYLESGKVQETHRSELQAKVSGKTLLLVAPGKSANDEKQKIRSEMKKKNVVSVSINFEYDGTDFIFLSNLRRFRELRNKDIYRKCIVTSNIVSDGVYLQTKYSDLIGDIEAVSENAGLMAIRFFMEFGVSKILLAGFDGYSHDKKDNYANSQLAFITQNAILDAMNDGMCRTIDQLSKNVDISFLTNTRYVMS